MPEMHLRQPRFTYSTCGTFEKKNKLYKNFKNRRFKIYSSKQTT